MRSFRVSGYVHTNPFSYPSVFDPTKTDTNIRVHTSVFDRPHELYEKTIRFRSSWETGYPIHDASVFENLRFRRFRKSTSVLERLHLGFAWKAFSKASVFVGQDIRFSSYYCKRSAKTHTKVEGA